MKDLINLIDRPSPQKKWLEKEKEVENGTQYRVKSEWPGAPEFDTYYRIGYEDDNSIIFIDFDGGPFLRKECRYLDYKIEDIFNDEDGLKMVLSDVHHN